MLAGNENSHYPLFCINNLLGLKEGCKLKIILLCTPKLVKSNARIEHEERTYICVNKGSSMLKSELKSCYLSFLVLARSSFYN